MPFSTPGTSPGNFSKKKAEDLESNQRPPSNLIVREEGDLFQERLNNVKDERKKRNVTFHGIPEVQDKEEVTPRDGLVPKHKTQNPLDNFGDA